MPSAVDVAKRELVKVIINSNLGRRKVAKTAQGNLNIEHQPCCQYSLNSKFGRRQVAEMAQRCAKSSFGFQKKQFRMTVLRKYCLMVLSRCLELSGMVQNPPFPPIES